MDPVSFRTDSTVTLLDHMGSDRSLARAARVSTQLDLDDEIRQKRNRGLIKYLMQHRHGSPFEHGAMTFRIETPIFVAREFFRHRVGFSYNEVSGRYSEMLPVFWIPSPERGLVNVGNSARPVMAPGSKSQREMVDTELRSAAQLAWNGYQNLLDAGVAREVARAALPLSTYTAFVATCNPRSLMHFLSLRVAWPDARYPSFPLYEIDEVARKMDASFQGLFPLTRESFESGGFVAP